MGLFKFIGSLLKVGAEDAADTADWNKLVDWISLHRSVTTTPYTTVAEDAFLTFNVATGTCNLINANDITIQAGKFYGIKNIAATALTVWGNAAHTATIDGSTSVTLAQNESLFCYTNATNWFKLTATAGSGETNLAANVGTGEDVFRDKTGVTLNFKTLVAGAGVSITPAADDVTISADLGGGTVADYIDFSEIASPATPGSNIARFYAVDRFARTIMAYKNSLGRTLYLTGERTHALAVPWYVRPGGSSGTGLGALMPLAISVTAGAANQAADVDGARKRFSTSAVQDTDTGFSVDGIVTGTNNPRFEVKFKLSHTTNIRFWCGLFESDPMGASTSSSNEKLCLRCASDAANVNFCLVTSNGTTETVVQVGVVDTDIHSIYLEYDAPNARIIYSWDGANVVASTTTIPAAATSLRLDVELRNITTGVDRQMDFWYLDGASDE